MESLLASVRKQGEGTAAALRIDEQRTALLTLLDEQLHPELCKMFLSSLAADANVQVPPPTHAYDRNAGGGAGGQAASKRRSTLPGGQRSNSVIADGAKKVDVNAANSPSSKAQDGGSIKVLRKRDSIQKGQEKALAPPSDGSLKNQA
jgi:hypothetical protein